MSITQGNAENYSTDAMTVSGRDISIGINEGGYYVIKVGGVGPKPDICTHLFTSLSEARKAVRSYVIENQTALNKQAFIEEMASKPTIKEQRKAERIAKSSSE